LIPDEVDKSLSLVLTQRHNLPIGLLRTHISGYLWQRLDGWLLEFLDKDSRWNLSTCGPQLGQNICANIVLSKQVMNLQARKFVFQLAHFLNIGVHRLLVAVPLFVDLLNDKKRVTIRK
jgi:hypothetical protein